MRLALCFALVFIPLALAGQTISVEEMEATGIEWTAHPPSPEMPPSSLSFTRLSTDVLLIPESTNDRVMILSATTGAPQSLAFIDDPTNLSTPLHAIANAYGTGVMVADQLDDGIIQFQADGQSLGHFAPAGGVDTSVLQNTRSVVAHQGGFIASVADGANADAIAKFSSGGVTEANFVTNAAGGMDSPWFILIRTNDILVSAINSDAIHRFDLNGAYLDDFVSVNGFPQQVHETPSGNILVANFSGSDEGILEYTSAGTFVGRYTYSALGGYRGVYELPNGTLVVTNGSGVYNVSRAGTVQSTLVSGVSARMIQSVPATSVLPVEFGSFNVTEDAGTAILDWTTYTETNNAGFEVEHRTSTDLPYQSLGFVTGQGTTVEPQSYQFVTPALEPGVHRFRLRQVDFDGTQTVTDEISVEIALPAAVTLALSAPAPNPATAFARARLTSATSQPVIVEVFDALGRRVSTVFDGRVDGGQTIELSVSLDALPNGLYFLRASTPTALKTRALSIVK